MATPIIQVFKNTPFIFDTTPYLNSRGWTIQGSTATHTSIVQGDIEFTKYRVIKDNVYEYSITIQEILSGTLSIVVGGVEVGSTAVGGYLQGTFTAPDNGYISIRSDGEVTIEEPQIKLSENGNVVLENSTITWSDSRKRWITFKDFIPELGFSMYTKLYTVKDGSLYAHDNTENFNNFYGVQYPSKLTFPVSSGGVKTYQSLAVHSNKIIATTEDGITTQLGHVSDLIPQDFTTKNGIHYANFLRDKVTDIVTGDRLKGRYILIDLIDDSDTKLQIFKVNVKSSAVTPNE